MTAESRSVRAIRGPHSNNERAVFELDRVKVINRFEITGNFLLARLIDFFFHSIDDLFHLHGFLYDVRSSQSTPVTFEQKSKLSAG